MRYPLCFSVLVGLCVLGASHAAQAVPCDPSAGVSCLEQECAPLGATRTDHGTKHIIACLWNQAGDTMIWKAMSAGMPAGSVVPFNRASCPDGWAPLAGVDDRTIIGTSATRPLGSTGGETAHTLTISELPPHTHDQNITVDGTCCADNPSLHFTDNADEGFRPWGTTSATGDGAAFNIMPHYVALLYCQKL